MRANREDEETGRFFQDRYHATRLTDESSLLACVAYVDLNLIRAAMAETLEQSDDTSVQSRIAGLVGEPAVSSETCGDVDSGGEAHDGRSRRSTICDETFLAMPIEDCLELLDWTSRQTAPR